MTTSRSSERGLPASIDSEKAILGAVLLGNEAYSGAAEKGLAADDFSIDSHRRIYRAISEMLTAGKPVDLVTLAEELVKRGQIETVGGHAYICSLTDGVPPRPNIRSYVAAVQEKSRQRRLIDLANRTIASVMDGESSENCVGRLKDSVGQLRFSQDEVSLEDFRRNFWTLNPGPIQWVVPGLIPLGGIAMLTGPAGVGKSFLALAMSRAIATGGEFLGPSRKCRKLDVLYLDRENPHALQRERCETLGIGPEASLTLWGQWESSQPPMIGDSRLIHLAKQQPFIVFDSFIRFHSAKENESAEIAPVMGWLRELASAGATVLILHHRSKAEGSQYRGSSDIAAGIDAGFSMNADDQGNLILDVFKTRMAAQFKLTIAANFAEGQFSEIESASKVEYQNEIAKITEIISQNPGISTNAIVRDSGIGKARVLQHLSEGIGARWEVDHGPRRSKLYFITPLVPALVPEDDARTSHRTSRSVVSSTGSALVLGGQNQSEPVAPTSSGSRFPHSLKVGTRTSGDQNQRLREIR